MQLRTGLLALSLVSLGLLSCTTAAPPPPSAPREQRLIDVDPRLGSSQQASDSLRRRFDAALRELRAGRLDVARQRFSDLAAKNPDYRPAQVALAALALRADDPAAADALLTKVLASEPDYTAARMLSAEAALRRNDLETAHTILQALAAAPTVLPSVQNALASTRTAWFDQLFASASAATDPEEAINLLRRALTLTPEADTARVALVRRLIEVRRYDDARRQIEPLAQKHPDREEVEWALAEIEAGRGRYQDSIARYERLAKAHPGRYDARLTEVKQKWLELNMPPQYRSSMDSPALSRAELAVLMYWKVSPVRFAQNLAQPPIAVDIGAVQGREEFVRALALRLYQVDSVTRAAGPDRLVSSANFLRLAGRLLLLRGTPPCAAGAAAEDELARAIRALTACGVNVSRLAGDLERTVSGREAAEVLDAVERVLGVS
jgi:tetratricopeptide (TPR) repeat protein